MTQKKTKKMQVFGAREGRQKSSYKKTVWLILAIIIVWAAGGAAFYMHEEMAREAYSSQAREAQAQAEQLRKKFEAEKAANLAEATREITDETCAAKGVHSNPTKDDVVVNTRRCLKPFDYIPAKITEVGGVPVSSETAPHLEAMMRDAASAGAGFTLTSGYRSLEDQQTACEYWVVSTGSQAAADKNCARPGYSEHQTGFAVDFKSGGCVLECFRGSAAYAWLHEHGAEYGFIERYLEDKQNITGYHPEPWHYRYVGREIALDMKKRHITTLEELWKIPGPGVTPGVPGF